MIVFVVIKKAREVKNIPITLMTLTEMFPNFFLRKTPKNDEKVPDIVPSVKMDPPSIKLPPRKLT